MDSRLNYAHIAKQVVLDYAEFYAQGGLTSLQPACDDERQRYLLLDIGWYDKKYIHNATIHLDVRDHKIWIQHDDTEEGVATDLLEAGVPKEDIVLGFQPQELRKYTEFADVPNPKPLSTTPQPKFYEIQDTPVAAFA